MTGRDGHDDPRPDVRQVAARLRELADTGALDLPLPGGGRTGERFRRLAAVAAENVSLGRLAEAHTDAVAILAEAARCAPAGALLGVWASEGPASRVEATRQTGGWRLDGAKRYCSGASVLDAALVTAFVGDEPGLFLVPLASAGVGVDSTVWRAPALAATDTGTVTLAGVDLAADALVGAPGFYLERPGFWQGSVGVAACWAGASRPIAATVRAAVVRGAHDDVHALAHLGAIEAAEWTMDAVLARAAAEIDADPTDPDGLGMRRALTVRHLVEQTCREILDRAARAAGPGPLAFDAAHAQRVADLTVYLRQHHGESDLETIARSPLPPT